jgi:hypothetical protein
MALRVVSFCRYLCNRSVVWRQCDWNAYKFVHAIKGDQLNGYAYVPVRNLQRRLSNQNLASAIEWFAGFAAERILQENIRGLITLIPVPNSGCTSSSSAKPSTRKLARAICEQLGDKAIVLDCLRWKKDLGSASKQGGPREAAILYSNLETLP